MVSRLERISYIMAKTAAYISAVVLVEMVLHILLEIVLRTVFKKSTYVLDEFVAYSVVCMTFLCMAYSMHGQKLIRVELFISRIKGKLRKAFEIFSIAIAFCITSGLVYFFWTKTFWRDLTRNRVSESIAEFPLWIPELIALVGLILFILQLLVMLLRQIYGDEKSPIAPT
jgi:TRAP-type C4-dicarboxylate transport system permease small subunit